MKKLFRVLKHEKLSLQALDGTLRQATRPHKDTSQIWKVDKVSGNVVTSAGCVHGVVDTATLAATPR